jgi:hypothetical protein
LISLERPNGTARPIIHPKVRLRARHLNSSGEAAFTDFHMGGNTK